MNPVALNQLMLQEMTGESVQAGAELTQQPTTRKLPDGKELTGIRAEVKTRTDTAYFEIVGYGFADQGGRCSSRASAARTRAPNSR
ncbi:hypothetical protein NKJ59_25515 [Mesorhizobium australicum]|nr:hypothetical protein [Mesorhizobium sp. LNHC229A00]ESY96689.1 hypothetical protein X741_04200 [Mesorhizobium sp. LNHC229A00]